VPRPRAVTVAGVAIAAALVSSACGGDGSSAGPATAGGTSGPGVAVEGAGPLPAVDVVDVTSGETVNLGSLLPADKPTLVWMWSPF